MFFARSALGQFFSTMAGRAARVIAGIAMIVLGAWIGGTTAVVLIVIGAVPLFAGLFDVCVISAILGGPLSGERVRALPKPR